MNSVSDTRRPQRLLDRHGQVWTWNPDHARRPDGPLGVYEHDGTQRTAAEIELDGEPVIEVRDPRVVAGRLFPTPADRVRLGDLVVLPGKGELSPVVGIYRDTDDPAT
nr:hypothetical protein [Kibdelosporangium sp. MJ126-NF4]CEL16580.1 hypothetical protein [Kibdelosporangium sp. MJ126-NF4]CTQ89069.1 hypothetical protein [Kibdelosporangium sp. MJ126-NF4]